MKKKTAPEVAIVMGSESDLHVMQGAADFLAKLGVVHELAILSAHRTPADVAEFASGARKRGIRVIVAGAGGAAHLPGMVAAYTELPVVGVPVPIGALQGEDALLSIVQMPRGVPVATVAIGAGWNAGVLAAQILGAGQPRLLDAVAAYKNELQQAVEKQRQALARGRKKKR